MASPVVETREPELLNWVNDNLPPTVRPATSFATSFKSGRLILRLAESLSHQRKDIADSRFGMGSAGANVAADADEDAHIDLLLDIFDFLLDLGVDTADVSVAEVIRGDDTQIVKLIRGIRTRFSTS